MAESYDVIIIGAGPAGLTAALYAGRARMKTLMLEKATAGGQAATTDIIENYPGFPEGATGPELVELMQKQAERFGARVVIDEATQVDLSKGSPFFVKTHGEEYEAGALIVCVGASPRKLGIPGEDDFVGRGVSFCATCDGFFFREKDVLVVGGGDSAMEESLFLTKFASRVRVVHRRDELRAGEALKRRASANEKIDFIWNTVLEEIAGDGKVEKALARNVKTGEQTELQTDGVFIFIGHYPNSSLFEGQLEMDDHKYLITDDHFITSVPGVFAAGEIQDPIFSQLAASVGQGCGAGTMDVRWLVEQE